MKKKALVVVLGELARSPRMQYHCHSLATNGFDVNVIAEGDQVNELNSTDGNVKQSLITNNFDFKRYLPSILAYILKPIWQTLLLMFQLFRTPAPQFILVQNPPSIPTLPLLYVYSRLVRCYLVIDWHNYGFSILSLQLGQAHPLVRLMKFIEIQFGRLADAGFCVSRAMQRDLVENYHITYPLHVLYDKPPSRFSPLDAEQKMTFINHIQDELPMLSNLDLTSNETAIVCSATSWTSDEDFGLLLEAMRKYEQSFDEVGHLPRLICIVTGKGPLKASFSNEINNHNLKYIQFVLPWLKAEDYPKMIGSSDLGISLHSSSSGVDLPMKVVDYFGCGLPVLAYKYPTINELVVEDEFGMTFKDSDQLHEQLKSLFANFKRQDDGSQLNRFRRNIIKKFLKNRWDDNWNKVAKPLFDDL